ncbi:hypothetical protein KGO06_00685 [Patescibacteria group bacterium]|nr:hypothetical protein [Patescibacteria group bacterium]
MAFIVSVFVVPAWVSMLLAVYVVCLPYGSLVAILGGVLLDATFGTPFSAGGVPIVYTALCTAMSVGAAAIQSRLLT